MDKSENINELASALAKVQGTITHASKDTANPFFKSKYADLASVWDACRSQLAENGLSIAQLPDGMEDNSLILLTTMMHESGQWISSKIKIPLAKVDPQGYGSALTYARRYALAAMVGVYQDDDDANEASGKNDKPKEQPKPVKPKIAMATNKQLTDMVSLAKQKNVMVDMPDLLHKIAGVKHSNELTELQADMVIAKLNELESASNG